MNQTLRTLTFVAAFCAVSASVAYSQQVPLPTTPAEMPGPGRGAPKFRETGRLMAWTR